MRKSEKSAYFRHIFVNNFFVWNFLQVYDGFKASNSAFYDTHIAVF
jgi:hypothetical protein